MASTGLQQGRPPPILCRRPYLPEGEEEGHVRAHPSLAPVAYAEVDLERADLERADLAWATREHDVHQT